MCIGGAENALFTKPKKTQKPKIIFAKTMAGSIVKDQDYEIKAKKSSVSWKAKLSHMLP